MRRVAVAIIKHDNKYLCAQRRPDKSLPLKWEFPGGKLEENETSLEALHREIREELDVDVFNVKLFSSMSYDYDFGSFDLDFYKCDIDVNAPITLSEHVDYEWFTLDEVKQLDFVESSKQVISKLD